VDDALKTRGIISLNVETALLFAPPSKFLATCLCLHQHAPLRALRLGRKVVLLLTKLELEKSQIEGKVTSSVVSVSAI